MAVHNQSIALLFLHLFLVRQYVIGFKYPKNYQAHRKTALFCSQMACSFGSDQYFHILLHFLVLKKDTFINTSNPNTHSVSCTLSIYSLLFLYKCIFYIVGCQCTKPNLFIWWIFKSPLTFDPWEPSCKQTALSKDKYMCLTQNWLANLRIWRLFQPKKERLKKEEKLMNVMVVRE